MTDLGDLLKPQLEHLTAWAATLPDLPAGWHYRFESDGFDTSRFDAPETMLTMRAIPERIHYFEDD